MCCAYFFNCVHFPSFSFNFKRYLTCRYKDGKMEKRKKLHVRIIVHATVSMLKSSQAIECSEFWMSDEWWVRANAMHTHMQQPNTTRTPLWLTKSAYPLCDFFLNIYLHFRLHLFSTNTLLYLILYEKSKIGSTCYLWKIGLVFGK